MGRNCLNVLFSNAIEPCPSLRSETTGKILTHSSERRMPRRLSQREEAELRCLKRSQYGKTKNILKTE